MSEIPQSLSPDSQQISLQDAATSLDKRRGIPAWILSLLLHSTIFAVLLLTIRQMPRGAPIEGDRQAGIVLVDNSQPDAQYLTSGDFAASAGDLSNSNRPLSETLPAIDAVNSDLLGALPNSSDSESIGADFSSGLPGAEGLLQGTSTNTDVGGKVTTQVFGIQGTGSKFIYVFDRSASMSGFGGRPLQAAKEQLIASLQSLGPTQQFQIIFYNQNPRIFNPSPGEPPRLLYGTEANIKLAEQFVNGIEAAGATQHLPALQLAVSMKPDVIFFLTDAEEPRLNQSELDRITNWNHGPASINSIEFGAGPTYNKNNFLVKLAKENLGQHTYKDVTQFGGHR
jgi:hypothetical protein